MNTKTLNLDNGEIMRINTTILFLILANISAQTYTIDDYVGGWSGQWENTTFGSYGPATMNLTSDSNNKTAEMMLDLDGFVFGGNDPDAMNLTGNYTDTEFTVSATTNLFGEFTLTVNNQGVISGQGINVPMEAIDRFEFSGTSTPLQMNMNYTIHFSAAAGGGNAFGVLNLNKSTVAVQDSEKYNLNNFILEQNHPNPFNPVTTINFNIPQGSRVNLSIYNIVGELVKELVNEKITSGYHTYTWDGTDEKNRAVSGGVYIYKLKAEQINLTKKMILLR